MANKKKHNRRRARNRQQVVRWVATSIVLALIMSFFVGAVLSTTT